MTREYVVSETTCRCGCRQNLISGYVVNLLLELSKTPNASFTITNGYRCHKYNIAVGGAPKSFHLSGLAVDIIVLSPKGAWSALKVQPWHGIGYNAERKQFHLDIGTRTALWHKVKGQYCYVL